MGDLTPWAVQEVQRILNELEDQVDLEDHQEELVKIALWKAFAAGARAGAADQVATLEEGWRETPGLRRVRITPTFDFPNEPEWPE